MHKKSSNHSITAARRKRGSRIRHTIAFFKAFTLFMASENRGPVTMFKLATIKLCVQFTFLCVTILWAEVAS